MASIQDIATLAGVSKATVSRILNQDPNFSVSEVTRNRVWQVANQLHYKLANVATRNHQDKLHLAMITALTAQEELAGSYFQEIIAGMNEQANRWGMKIADRIRLPVTDEIDWQNLSVYGAVLVVGVLTDDVLAKIYKYNKNIVIVDDSRIFENYDVIRNDFGRQTKHLLDLLSEKGHQRIAFVGGQTHLVGATQSEQHNMPDVRHQAYLEWMLLHRLENYTQTYITEWTSEGAMQATKKLLQEGKRPTAIMASSDIQAIGVYRAIQEMNDKIPDDIAVVSFDGIDTSAYLYPSLTSVRPAAKEMGKEAINLAREKLVGDRESAIQLTINSKVLLRESI